MHRHSSLYLIAIALVSALLTLPCLAQQLSVGPLAFGGAANVPRAATYRRADYQLLSGASFRMVLDVGNWDQSVTINTPGQSL